VLIAPRPTRRRGPRRERPRTITIDKSLSRREAMEWSVSGGLTLREITRLRQLAHDRPYDNGR
jgi:hypothetical protein